MKDDAPQWQYEVIHKKPKDFKMGEQVFLKGSPSKPMMVAGLGEKNVVAVWKGEDGKRHAHAFPPQMLLQYRYAGLMVDSTGTYKVCLN
jgi:hypothetical protein